MLADEGWASFMDFAEIYGLPNGLRIPKDTNIKLTIRIRDDCTGASDFNCVAKGFKKLDEPVEPQRN